MNFLRSFLVCFFAVAAHCHHGHHHGDGNHGNEDGIMCEGKQAMDVTNKLMEKDTNLFVQLVFGTVHFHVNHYKKMVFLRPTYIKIKKTLGDDVVVKLRGDKKEWSEGKRAELIETLIEKDVELLAALACGTVKYHAKMGRRHGKNKEVDALEETLGKDFMKKIGNSEWALKQKLRRKMGKHGGHDDKDRHHEHHDKDRHHRDHEDRPHRDHHHGHHNHKDHHHGHRNHKDHHHGHRNHKDHHHGHQGEFCPARHDMVKKLRQHDEHLFKEMLVGAVFFFATNHRTMPETAHMWREIKGLLGQDLTRRIAQQGTNQGDHDMRYLGKVLQKLEQDPEMVSTLTCGSLKWMLTHSTDDHQSSKRREDMQKLFGAELLQKLKGSPWPWEIKGHHGPPPRHGKLSPKLHELIEYLKDDAAMVDKVLGHYKNGPGQAVPDAHASPMPPRKQPDSYPSPMPDMKQQPMTYDMGNNRMKTGGHAYGGPMSAMSSRKQPAYMKNGPGEAVPDPHASPMPPRKKPVSYPSPMPDMKQQPSAYMANNRMKTGSAKPGRLAYGGPYGVAAA